MILLLLILLILCGCTSGDTSTLTNQVKVFSLPIKIEEKSTIAVVPVLPPEPEKIHTFFSEDIAPEDAYDRYIQNKQYISILAYKIKDNLERKEFLSFVANPIRIEDFYQPEFFEVFNLSCPSDYYLIVYLYEITNSQKKIQEKVIYEKDGSYPIEQWEQEGHLRGRIELYETFNYSLIWQAEIKTHASILTKRNVSKTKALDNLISSLVLADYYEKVNNEVIDKSAYESVLSLESPTVEINPQNTVKVDIYLYDKKVSHDTLLKGIKIKISPIIPIMRGGLTREFTTDEIGEVRIELPEGFYKIEVFLPLPNGELKTNIVQTLIIGSVRRINIVMR
jgi:hypothetical protein